MLGWTHLWGAGVIILPTTVLWSKTWGSMSIPFDTPQHRARNKEAEISPQNEENENGLGRTVQGGEGRGIHEERKIKQLEEEAEPGESSRSKMQVRGKR